MSVQGGHPEALGMLPRFLWHLPRHVVLAIVTAVILTTIYLLYGLVINPLVEANISQQLTDRSGFLPPPPSEGVSMASQHLAGQHWAADAKYQYRTNDAFVYAEEWQAVDSDRAIQFTPFAMIWMQNKQVESEPPITVSSRSARVQFASAFDFANPRPGRVTGGALQGEVRIEGPNGLMIEGRNFDFSETAMRLWSDHPVKFAYDGHRGTARGLQVDLIASEHPAEDGTLAVSGIRKIQLLQDVSLELLLKDDPAGPNFNSSTVAQVRCAGRFEFDVVANIATFSDDVRVYRPTDARHADSLQCDLLTLKFESQSPLEQPETETERPDAEQRFEGIQSDLAFRRMRAQGRRVVLISEANQLTAHMSDLVYDQQTRVAAMTHGESVRVLAESSELRCPEITLMHDSAGRVESVWCRGAGWLKHHDAETGALELVARWARQLRKYREPDSPWEVIEFDRQAVVRHPGRQMGLSADFIKVWLDVARDPDAGVGGSQGARSTDPASERVAGDFELHRLLALRDVAVASPRLQGETQRLEVWFERGPAGDRTGTGSQQLVASPGTGSLTLDTPQPDRPNTRDPSQAPAQPLQVESDRIQVKMLKPAGAKQFELGQIISEGRVEIRQIHEPGVEPLFLTGDRLQLESRAEHDQVLHVSGSPAHIRDRGTHIQGRQVHLDRSRNLAWVSGAGLLQLPVTKNLNGDKLNSKATLDIWWSEQMSFDGETGRFFGNVSGVLGDTRMRCQE
ncbi:MAG: hypothetical protein ABGZ17_32365, partial [Planctomycetaceae bacterium]